MIVGEEGLHTPARNANILPITCMSALLGLECVTSSSAIIFDKKNKAITFSTFLFNEGVYINCFAVHSQQQWTKKLLRHQVIPKATKNNTTQAKTVKR